MHEELLSTRDWENIVFVFHGFFFMKPSYTTGLLKDHGLGKPTPGLELMRQPLLLCANILNEEFVEQFFCGNEDFLRKKLRVMMMTLETITLFLHHSLTTLFLLLLLTSWISSLSFDQCRPSTSNLPYIFSRQSRFMHYNFGIESFDLLFLHRSFFSCALFKVFFCRRILARLREFLLIQIPWCGYFSQNIESLLILFLHGRSLDF